MSSFQQWSTMPSESYPLGRKADIVLDSTKLTGWIFLVHEIPSFSQQSLECHRAYLYPIPSEHPIVYASSKYIMASQHSFCEGNSRRFMLPPILLDSRKLEATA